MFRGASINTSNNHALKSLFFTTLALTAFAANSVLCRLALGESSIDAASFTIIRLLSGAITLLLIFNITRDKNISVTRGSWQASLMLFIYAITFSYAYISLDTGTGALILFGSVQITMILLSLLSGNRLHFSEWLGVLIAFSGFVYLILPSVTTPSVDGFILMTVAGIAWGIYTLKGRGSVNPLSDTTFNFLRTMPFVIVLVIFTFDDVQFSTEGIFLAILSGSIASGVGYTIWYIALGSLSTTRAAVVQLAVPVIAAVGGVIFVSESITIRLTLSASMILGGILLVILGQTTFVQKKQH